MLRLETCALCGNNLHIVPAVDVDFLNILSEQPRREDRILRHFYVELVCDLAQRHIRDIIVVVLHILLDKAFHHILFVGFVKLHSVVFSHVLLYAGKKGVERNEGAFYFLYAFIGYLREI